jgi:hypothetical protein
MSGRRPHATSPDLIRPYEQREADHHHDDAKDGIPTMTTHRRAMHCAGSLRDPYGANQAQHDSGYSSRPHG